MNICKITSIKPDGKPWESQYGTMYPFYLVLEDGMTGTANSKTDTPAYKVGETVGYDVTGKSPKGVPKLKITRNPDPTKGTQTYPDTHPDLEAANPAPQRSAPRQAPASQQTRQNAPTATGTPIHGATVGGALARAVEIWRHVRPAGSGAMPDRQDIEDIEHTTRQLVAIQQRIESGVEDEASVPF